MSKQKLTGYLGKKMREHLELRRALGRSYEANEGTLLRLNQLINEKWPRARTITREMVMRFLRTNQHMKTISRKNELTYIRMFCTDLAASGAPTYMPERKMLPKANPTVRVHIFTEKEVLRVMKAAEKLSIAGTALNLTTFVGLLWSTGLRPQEALSVNIGDIDWEEKILRVIKGKYGKSRIVPLSQSTLAALGRHIKKMRSLRLGVGDESPIFANRRGKRLSKSTVSHILHGLYRAVGIRTAWNGYPRTMDLRHSFATGALKAIREDGSDPSSHIPALAVVMGHSHIAHTQTYLHPSMETLQVASKAFEKKLLKFKGAA